jgi:plasmid stabilization system protein ParE
MRRLEITEPALDDLAAARRWLRQPGAGQAAARRLRHIERALTELRTGPCRWPYSEHEGARERVVEGYKIVYEVRPDTGDNASAGDVLVLRIFGPGQFSDRL